jgi:hypothetical protein
LSRLGRGSTASKKITLMRIEYKLAKFNSTDQLGLLLIFLCCCDWTRPPPFWLLALFFTSHISSHI